MFESYVYPFGKKEYIHGKKPKVDCILCEIVKDSKKVLSLKVAESYKSVITVNLYPYNSGHIMIFPKRHIEDFTEFTDEEYLEIFILTKLFVKILKEKYKATGFNVGFNTGKNAGASIKHLHQHIIPRYPDELGIIDLIGGAKVLIEDPKETQRKLIEYLSEEMKKDEFKLINLKPYNIAE